MTLDIRRRFTLDPIRQREFAIQVVERLRAAGFQALWAGGCVRDQLLGVVPKDYDVATDALPDQVREVFGKRRTLAIGAAFGVITVLGPKAAGQIEVATFRTDVAYTDGRRPDSVQFTTAEEDAQRRDFTINGLFFDPVDQKLIDYVGGQQDLQAKVIRAIGVPAERFEEDKLRTLRAVRFAAALGFEIDGETAKAIRQFATGLAAVSAERIGAELRRMLVNDGRGRALALLYDLGLLGQTIPAASPFSPEQVQQRSAWLERLEPATLPAALCCVLYETDSKGIQTVARQLKYPNKEVERTGWITEHLAWVAACESLPWSKVQPVASHPGAVELVATYEAIHGPCLGATHLAERSKLPPMELDPPPLLTGDDLVQSGLRPGRHFGPLLQAIRDGQLDGKIASAEEALSLAREFRPAVDD